MAGQTNPAAKKSNSAYEGSLVFQELVQFICCNSPTIAKEDFVALLELMEVPEDLKLLPRALENLLKISGITSTVCAKPRWRPIKKKILSSLPTCAEINKLDIAASFPNLTKSTGKSWNDSFAKRCSQSQIYATVGHRPPEQTRDSTYIHLQCQALVAMLTIRMYGPDDFQEAYKNTIENALSTVRALADSPEDKGLDDLPRGTISPEKYLERIKRLPQSHRIHDFARLIEAAQALQSPAKKHRTAEDVLAFELRHPQEVSPLGDLLEELERRPSLTPESIAEVYERSASFLPDNVPEIYEFLPPPFSIVPGGDFVDRFNAAQASKSLSKDNQLLPIAWNELTTHDLASLINALLSPSAPPTQDALTKASLHLMLWVGFSAPRVISTLKASISGPPSAERYDSSQKTLHLLTPGPSLSKDEKSYVTEHAIPKKNYIDLKLPQMAQKAIEQALTQLHDEAVNKPLNPQTINLQCQEYIRHVNRRCLTDLTLTRIQNFHFRALTRMPRSDIAAAALILGREEYLARTKIHYASFDEFELQETFWRSCCKILREVGHPTKFERNYPPEETLHIGSPFRPRGESIRIAIENLKSDIHKARARITTAKNLINFHNIFTAYTALLIAYGTGHRRVGLPFIPSTMQDSETRYACIRDKDTPDWYHSRLIWLQKMCCQQLDHYRHHMQYLLEPGKDSSTAQDPASSKVLPEIFLLTQKGIVTTTSAFLAQILEDYGYQYPGHPQRHHLKSALQEDGCDPEITEIFLGHWNLGLEAWTTTSSLHPFDYKGELERCLPPILQELHFSPMKGLEAPPPIRLNIRQPKSQKPKLNTRTAPSLPKEPPGEIWRTVLGKSRRIGAEKLLEEFRYTLTSDDENPLDAIFRDDEKHVLHALSEHLKDIYLGNFRVAVTEQQLEMVLKDLDRKDIAPKSRFKRLNYLRRGLETGNKRYGTQVPVTAIPRVLVKERNRVNPKMMLNVHKLRIIEKAFLKNLQDPIPPKTQLRLGQIFTSAILYGGILYKGFANGFLWSLMNAIHQHNDWLWTDLWAKPAHRQLEESERIHFQTYPKFYRRWVADPLTQLLIYRWVDQAPGDRTSQPTYDPWKVLQTYLEWIGVSGEDQPEDMSELIIIARTRYTLTIPSYLAAFAENKLPSACLSDPVWLRSLTGKCLSVKPKYDQSTQSKAIDSLQHYSESSQRKRYKILLDILGSHQKTVKSSTSRSRDLIEETRGNAIEAIDEFLKKHEHKLSPILQLLARWAIQLLRKKIHPDENRQVAPLKIKTILEYLGCFGPILISSCRGNNPLNFNVGDYNDLYKRAGREILRELATQARQKNHSHIRQATYNKRMGRLNQFHNFLQVFYNQPEVNVETWLIHAEESDQSQRNEAEASMKNLLNAEFDPAQTSISANLITLRHYENILNLLNWKHSDLTRSQKMSIIAIILAFRTGLRRMEVLGLSLGDFRGGDKLHLQVKPNQYRHLKTASATRRIPLFHLLPPDELGFLRDWLSLRNTEQSGHPRDPLFSESGISHVPLPDEAVFKYAREIMKRALKDSTLVLHHCRDSFLQTHYLRLFLREDIPLYHPPFFLKGDLFQPRERQIYYEYFFPNDRAGRKKLFSGAILMGHADIYEGFRSYFHLGDWLLGYYLRHSDHLPALSLEALQQLTCAKAIPSDTLLQNSDNPLNFLVRQTSQDFSTRFIHPLMEERSYRIPKNKPRPPSKGLPQFDVALSVAIAAKGRYIIPKSEQDYILAQSFYEKIQSQSLLRQDKAVKIARIVKSGYKTYANYVQICKFQDARKIFDFFEMIEIRKESMTVRYFPSGHYGPQQWEKGYERWVKRGFHNHIEKQFDEKCGIKNPYGCLRIFFHKFDSDTGAINLSKAIALLLNIIC